MSNKTIKICYFASLREQLGLAEESIKVSENINTVGQLKTLLQQRGECWGASFENSRRLMMAVNQQMAKTDTTISHNDEVAFFPPVTGG